MGLYITIGVVSQSGDLSFDTDFDTINRELVPVMDNWFEDQQHSEGANFVPKFLHSATLTEVNAGYHDVNLGGIMFYDREGDGVSGSTETWGLFGLDAAQIVANHLTHGEIVFEEDIEGNSNNYYKVTPGKAEKVKPKF